MSRIVRWFFFFFFYFFPFGEFKRARLLQEHSAEQLCSKFLSILQFVLARNLFFSSTVTITFTFPRLSPYSESVKFLYLLWRQMKNALGNNQKEDSRRTQKRRFCFFRSWMPLISSDLRWSIASQKTLFLSLSLSSRLLKQDGKLIRERWRYITSVSRVGKALHD